MAHIFVFDHIWQVPAGPDEVYAALAAVDDYPQWWRQVRSVRRLDEGTGEAKVRGVLPYTLRLRLRGDVEDPAVRRLRVGIGGDLEGWASFDVARAPGRPGEEGHTSPAAVSTARYRQEVSVAARYLRRAVPCRSPSRCCGSTTPG